MTKTIIHICKYVIFIFMCIIGLINLTLKKIIDLVTLKWLLKMLGKRGYLDWLDDI